MATAAVQNLLGGEEAMGRARKPEVYSDAAYVILNKPSREYTGNTLLCEDVLVESGVTDLSVYDCVPGAQARRRLLGGRRQPAGVHRALTVVIASAAKPGAAGHDRRSSVAVAATPGIAALVKAGVPHEVLHFDVVHRPVRTPGTSRPIRSSRP